MQNFVIEETNNTNDRNLPCTFSQNFTGALLEKPNNYKLAVTRLKVPSSLLQTFHLTDAERSDYWLRIDYPTSDADITGNKATSGNIMMPNLDSDLVNYHSPKDVVEAINRTLQIAHETVHGHFTTNKYKNTAAVTVASGNNATTANVVSISGATKITYIKFTINTIALTDPEIPIKISLTNATSGKKCSYANSKCLSLLILR